MESPQEPGAGGSSGVDGRNPLGPRRTQFLCSILCGRVRKARALVRKEELATGKACRLHPSD